MSQNKSNLKPCKEDKPYVFVSYARVNQNKVRSDVLELQERSCNVWLDSKNMVGGKPVEQTDAIIRNPNCKALIFYMCERSVCSKYCLAELRVAKKYDIPIIPVHCFPVSGLEETIIKLQRHMGTNEEVDVSDAMISEILKTKNDSEVISIPYDTPSKISEIIKSLKGNGAGEVFTGQTESEPETASVPTRVTAQVSAPETINVPKKTEPKFPVINAQSSSNITVGDIIPDETMQDEKPEQITKIISKSLTQESVVSSEIPENAEIYLPKGIAIIKMNDSTEKRALANSVMLSNQVWESFISLGSEGSISFNEINNIFVEIKPEEYNIFANIIDKDGDNFETTFEQWEKLLFITSDSNPTFEEVDFKNILSVVFDWNTMPETNLRLVKIETNEKVYISPADAFAFCYYKWAMFGNGSWETCRSPRFDNNASIPNKKITSYIIKSNEGDLDVIKKNDEVISVKMEGNCKISFLTNDGSIQKELFNGYIKSITFLPPNNLQDVIGGFPSP